MNQVKTGTVVLLNGQTTVRHAWDVRLQPGVSGSFAIGQALSWAGGGAGTVAYWDTLGRALRFSRSAGPEPAQGTTLIAGPTGSGTISQVLSGSPPRWDLQLAGVTTAEVVFEKSNLAFVGSAWGRDFFTISPAWPNATAYDSAYGINTDFTNNFGLPILQPGDLGIAASVTEGFKKLDRRLRWLGAEKRYSADLVLVTGHNVVSWTLNAEDVGGWITTAGRFVVPTGITRVSVAASLTFNVAMSPYYFEIRKNGAAVASARGTNLISQDLVLPDNKVVSGDYFEVYATGTGIALIVAASSFFKIRAEEIA